jgi:hypothetical protein
MSGSLPVLASGVHPFPTTAEGQLAAVLWLSWNPLGGVASTNEYVSYVPELLTVLRSQPTTDQLAAELGRLRVEYMGDGGTKRELQRRYGDLRAASSILDWFFYFVKNLDPPMFEPVEGWSKPAQ